MTNMLSRRGHLFPCTDLHIHLKLSFTYMVKSHLESHFVFKSLKLELQSFQQFAQRSAEVLHGACSKRLLGKEWF